MRRKAAREIRLAIDVATDNPGAWRLVAECDDELTQMIMLGGERLGIVRPGNAELRGELGKALVAEHLGRCSACRAWRGDRAVVARPPQRVEP